MGEILISKAPDDPAEKKAWATQMSRIQYAMWCDEGAKCAACGRPYNGPDDFLARDPMAGMGWPKVGGGKSDFAEMFVDKDCAPGYAERHLDWPYAPVSGSTNNQEKQSEGPTG